MNGRRRKTGVWMAALAACVGMCACVSESVLPDVPAAGDVRVLPV